MSNYLISVANMRATVSRQEPTRTGYVLEAATNWEDLEDEAGQAVLQVGGGINLSGLYPCPDELAARAKWRQGGPRGGGRPRKHPGDAVRLTLRVPQAEVEGWRLVFDALLDGDAASFEVDEDYDRAVARWLREQAAGMNPTEYLPDALGGIASAIEEAIFRKRRRDREEMDALNADAGAVAPGE